MNTNLSPRAVEFINSVLQLKPALAAFDCDGTLWAGDAGEGFFAWELARGVVSPEIVRWARQRYADYKAGKVDEDTMCAEMVTMHRGLRESDAQRLAKQYFDENMAAQIFPEMRELLGRLQSAGCDVWAVSSTSEWVIRAAMPHFGIPQEKILAAAVHIEDGVITDRVLRIPSGEGKARGTREMVKRDPDAAFGNSIWDVAMLEIARHAFAINPTAQLQEIARQRKWTIYFPDGI